MKNSNIRQLLISIILPTGLLLMIFVFSQWQTINETSGYQTNSAIENRTSSLIDLNIVDNKQRGAHVFGLIDSTNFQFLIHNNIEWVTLVAWADQEAYDSPIMKHHNGDSLRMLKSDSMWLSRLELAHSLGFKIFLKPHVWIFASSEGKWRSDIFPTNEENWELWKKSYRDFIVRYAILAEKANVEMFCVGTELSRLSVEKPVFWKDLIQEVRSIYSGKITYAANWYNEYEKIDFWDDLDYIGIQAYFPLVKNRYPSVQQISKGWSKHFPAIESIHKKYNRKILFTEMGYKSTADSAVSPWEWIENPSSQGKSYSIETQANCYEAFFNTVWAKQWFAGVHIWQLRSDYPKGNLEKDNLDFTPMRKPAEKIIAEGFE
jgi:hypothetical protein